MNASPPGPKWRDRRDEKQVEAKLKELDVKFRRNERLMREAFIRYLELMSVKASLVADMQALQEFREARQRNVLKFSDAYASRKRGTAVEPAIASR